MKKTKTWKWVLIIGVLVLAAYQIQRSLYRPSCPAKYEIENFPLFAQPDGVSCGPTSLKMLLKYYGQDHPLEEIRKHTKTDWYMEGDVEIGGTTPEYMEIALEHYGVEATMLTSDMDKLKWYVSQKRPPVAMVRSGDKTWHWVVVTGYTEDTIITSDPGGGEREILGATQFEKAWNFTSDLYGRDVTKSCPACGGDGQIVDWAGPFGICDVCGGNGKLPDWHSILIELGEAKGYILIVPDNPKE
jgi:hypothetical protein